MLLSDDAKTLSEEDRRRLTRLMNLAFCDVRGLTIKPDRFQQAHDLADAFHNLPLLMYRDDFSLKFFLEFLKHYQTKYEGRLTIDYLKEWEKPLQPQ